jgi:hypothetical protein
LFESSSNPSGRNDFILLGSASNETAMAVPTKCQGGVGTMLEVPFGDFGSENPVSIYIYCLFVILFY